MREQKRKQIEWRIARRIKGKSPLHEIRSFRRASVMDQNDLYSAAHEFEDEINAFILWLNQKGKDFKPAIQQAGFDNDHLAECDADAA